MYVLYPLIYSDLSYVIAMVPRFSLIRVLGTWEKQSMFPVDILKVVVNVIEMFKKFTLCYNIVPTCLSLSLSL